MLRRWPSSSSACVAGAGSLKFYGGFLGRTGSLLAAGGQVVPGSLSPPPPRQPAAHAAARGKRLSKIKQREYFPGIRRDVRKFEGDYTYDAFKNTAALLGEAKGFLVVPIMFSIAAAAQYFIVTLPLFFRSWSFFFGYTMWVLGSARYFARGRRNTVTADLRGTNVVITGATSGIGLETAKQLAAMGANILVISHNKDAEHAKASLEAIRAVSEKAFAQQAGSGSNDGDDSTGETPSPEITFSAVEFTDLVQVRDFCRRMRAAGTPIDILVNNVGILTHSQTVTKFGDDEMLAVNLLAPYLLTEGLLPLVEKAAGRIVNVSSSSHVAVGGLAVPKYLSGRGGLWSETAVGHKYDGLEQYGFTKLGLIFHAQELATRSYPKKEPLSRQAQAAAALQSAATASAPSFPQQRPRYLCCSLTPGGAVTNIYRRVPYKVVFQYLYYVVLLVLRTPFEGSQTVVNCCVRDDLVNGGYYMDCEYRPAALSRVACDVKERAAVLEWVQKKLQPFMKWD